MSIIHQTRSQSNRNPAPRGGQHTLGGFGYASFTAPAPAVAPARPVARRGDDQPRRAGGLSFGARRAVFRAKVAVAVLDARKGHTTPPAPAPVAPPAPCPVAVEFARRCKARPLVAGFSAAQFDEWLDENYAEAMAHQARMADLAADEYEGAGLAAARTPAMERAAAQSERRDARDWNDLADLAATPEWDRILPFGSVEAACALD